MRMSNEEGEYYYDSLSDKEKDTIITIRKTASLDVFYYGAVDGVIVRKTLASLYDFGNSRKLLPLDNPDIEEQEIIKQYKIELLNEELAEILKD